MLGDVGIEFNATAAGKARERIIASRQAALDVQVIKDSNRFCPEADGTLQSSAVLSSVIGSGVVRWATPYARRQYYEFPRKSLDRNPNARTKWFEHAKARFLDVWREIAGVR